MQNRLTLSANELHEITGRKRHSAQIRVLEQLRIPVKPRPDGSPCVYRDAAARVMGAGHIDSDDSTVEVELDLGAL